MSAFRKIHTKFWTDPRVLEEMTPEDRYFYLYILTNPNTTQIGIYQITKKQMAFELGYSTESINSLMDRFINHHNLIRYNHETRELAILNWGKHNFDRGGKPVEDCIIKELKDVKDKELIKIISENIENIKIKDIFYNYLLLDNDTYDDTSTIRITIRGQEEEKEEEEEEEEKENIYSLVVDYLNKKCNTNYKHTTAKTKAFIKARLNEHFNTEDFYKVIDIKSKEWLGTNMEKYLRPETLFGTKFESYLNQKVGKYGGNTNNNKKNEGKFDFSKINDDI